MSARETCVQHLWVNRCGQRYKVPLLSGNKAGGTGVESAEVKTELLILGADGTMRIQIPDYGVQNSPLRPKSSAPSPTRHPGPGPPIGTGGGRGRWSVRPDGAGCGLFPARTDAFPSALHHLEELLQRARGVQRYDQIGDVVSRNRPAPTRAAAEHRDASFTHHFLEHSSFTVFLVFLFHPEPPFRLPFAVAEASTHGLAHSFSTIPFLSTIVCDLSHTGRD